MVSLTLEKLVEYNQHIEKMLYEVQNNLSEATFLECYNHCQEQLRLKGYHNIANQFIINIGEYHYYRMNNPLKFNYQNLRKVKHLGIDMFFAEDHNNSTKTVKSKFYTTTTNN